jgi:hypothetical protein
VVVQLNSLAPPAIESADSQIQTKTIPVYPFTETHQNTSSNDVFYSDAQDGWGVVLRRLRVLPCRLSLSPVLEARRTRASTVACAEVVPPDNTVRKQPSPLMPAAKKRCPPGGKKGGGGRGVESIDEGRPFKLIQKSQPKNRPLVQSKLPFPLQPPNAAVQPPPVPPHVPPQPQQPPLPPPPLHPNNLDGAAPSGFAAGAESIEHWDEYYQGLLRGHSGFLRNGYEGANLQGLREQEAALLKRFQEQEQEKDAARQVEVESLKAENAELKVENGRLKERAILLSKQLTESLVLNSRLSDPTKIDRVSRSTKEKVRGQSTNYAIPRHGDAAFEHKRWKPRPEQQLSIYLYTHDPSRHIMPKRNYEQFKNEMEDLGDQFRAEGQKHNEWVRSTLGKSFLIIYIIIWYRTNFLTLPNLQRSAKKPWTSGASIGSHLS